MKSDHGGKFQEFTNYPTTVLNFAKENLPIHPTQKPVELIEYLVKTYTLENEIVLDFCSGSGTTAVACHNLHRRFICIEKDHDYWAASVERLRKIQEQGLLF
jgi:site-specific DNA-methyltransferase (adenine-specific)